MNRGTRGKGRGRGRRGDSKPYRGESVYVQKYQDPLVLGHRSVGTRDFIRVKVAELKRDFIRVKVAELGLPSEINRNIKECNKYTCWLVRTCLTPFCSRTHFWGS